MTTTITKKYFYVYTRPTWQSNWSLQPYITPLSVVRACAPQVDRAVLRLHWGTGVWENGVSMVDAVNMPDITNHYVKITSDDAATPTDETVIFIGIVGQIETNPLGQTYTGTRSADQKFMAYGLETLLEQRIQKSQILTNGGTRSEIKHVQSFNRRAAGGEIQGNRSTGRHAATSARADGAATFLFDVDSTDIDATDVWTNRDIIEYILAYNQLPDEPGGPWFGFAPATGVGAYLDQLVDVWDVSKLTTRQVFNAICNRARGLTWFIDYDPNTEKTNIRIKPMLDEELEIDGITVPANAEPVPIDLWGSGQNTQVKIKQDDTQRFDTIIVAGSNIKICGTWDYSDGDLAIGWTSTLETAYKNASKDVTGYGALSTTAQALLNDQFRATDRFNNVYTLFRVPASWTWTLDTENAAPTWDRVAAVLDPATTAGYWNGAKRFLPRLPFKEGFDYSSTAASSENVSGSDAEFRRPFAFAQNADDEWVYLDKIAATPAAVRILQTEMGVQVRFKPPYIFSGTSKTGFEPGGWTEDLADYGIPYTTLKLTAMVETDETFEIETVLQTKEYNRTKTITIPNAELWYIVPGTTIDIDDAGAEIAYGGTDPIIRNDVEKLKAVAAAAASWYAKTRYKVFIKNEELAEPWEGYLGKLLQYENPNDQGGPLIGSTVTSVAYSLTGPRVFMSLATDNAELDLAAVFGSGTQSTPASIPSLNVAEREIAGVKQTVASMQTEINKNPLRIETGSSSSGATTRIRRAYAKAAAGASGSITCYLDTDGTGEEVSVACEVTNGTNLNAALPRLADGDMIHVWNDGGTWRSIMTFHASEDCS
jgi:hypothetical protein